MRPIIAAYISLCASKLSPYAKQDFVNTFLNPDLSLSGCK